VRHGTAIPPHLDARNRRLSVCGHPQFRPNQECCIVARPATRSRLLLWAPVAPERQSRTVADGEATRLVIRESGSLVRGVSAAFGAASI
jgi:hypothetical protein